MADETTTGIAVFGTGRAGGEIIKSCAARRELRLAAGITTSQDKDGVDAGELVGGNQNGVRLTRDLDAVLARPDVDVVIYAGLGDTRAMVDFLTRCADAGKDAITVAGLIHPVTALGDEGAAELDRRARSGRARIVGTGVNPGFLLDVLPATWATMVSEVTRVRARRVADIRHWGDGVLEHEIGVGQPLRDAKQLDALALNENVALVADALGLNLDRREDIHEPLAALTPREHDGRRAERGTTVGFQRIGRGWSQGEIVIELEWRAVFCLDPDVDGAAESASLEVSGETQLAAHATGTFLSDPYPATAARALNAVLPLRSLRPGLYRPDQLPVSRSEP